MTAKCGMWLDIDGRRECGKPATLGWDGESGVRVPICEDCISRLDYPRKSLKPTSGGEPE